MARKTSAAKKEDLKVNTTPAGSVSADEAYMKEMKHLLKSVGITFEADEDMASLTRKMIDGMGKIIKEPGATSKDMSYEKLVQWAGPTNLSDETLLRKIYRLGIPPFFIRAIRDPRNKNSLFYLFNDHEYDLKDRDIQYRVRHCGFSPTRLNDVLHKKSVQPSIDHSGTVRGNSLRPNGDSALTPR